MADDIPTPDDAQKLMLSRQKDFINAYGELVEKHKIDFATYPQFVPDGQGGFKVIIQSTPVDVSNVPQKSPFIA